ncbi:hypothetical protein CVV68_12420 [Arthrobacter livingstonensis]|uniref:Uncharacterized protein n=1 Tax=Arthrobacter livingstonensis TaxID=670078 RepID=A0A2V5LAV1_9MICC|nr:hypothetical protein CVV68_12420 [Arthrobacter livingstonensis]
MLAFLAVLFILVFRLQLLQPEVAARVAASAAAVNIEDDSVVGLATGIGSYLGIILSAAFTSVYFSVASTIESRVLPGLKRGRGRLQVGLLGAVSIVSLVGIQLFSLLAGLQSPKAHWGSYLFVLAIAAAVPLWFHSIWSGLSRAVIVWMFGISVVIAATSLLF